MKSGEKVYDLRCRVLFTFKYNAVFFFPKAGAAVIFVTDAVN